MHVKSFTLTLISASILLSNIAIAQNVVYKANDPAATVAYWTPERMRDAEPMDLPQVDPKSVKKLTINELKSQFEGVPIGKEGSPPSVDMTPDMHQYFQPKIKEYATTLDVGSLNEQFTSAQLTPTSAVTTYPYRAVGKLFFTTPSGNKTCSGSVISPRVVLTAGHCVHNGNGNSTGWYSNFMFVPAFNNGAAPYLTWHASYISSTSGWVSGGGTVPNAADWGMLEISDQVVNGTTTKLGSAVGFLGWLTLSTIPNHATILGYPAAFDSGQLMHQVLAQSALAVAPNNAEYGSDMSLGAGGGPWIQNFGTASTGQTGGLNSARTRVIGVTSYGYNNTTSLGNGSAIFDNTNFVSLYNFICAHQTGNC